MLTAAAVAAAGYLAARLLLRRMRAEVGLVRVRVAALPSHVGALVRFRHPTRRWGCVEGRLLAAGESLLSLAWIRVTIEHPDGSRGVYEARAGGWAQVASGRP